MDSITFEIPDAQSMLEFARKFALTLVPGDVLYFQGDLGAGKTTLATGLLHGLGHQGTVKSPTYTIVEPYTLSQTTVFHFDLYRLTDPEELVDMGFSDYLQPEAILIVEWHEKAQLLLPEATVTCHIEYADQGRQLELVSNTERGRKIISQVNELLLR